MKNVVVIKKKSIIKLILLQKFILNLFFNVNFKLNAIICIYNKLI